MLAAVDNLQSTLQLAILQIDNLQISIPQHQIASVNLITDLDTSMAKHNHAGWITKDSLSWPIYGLSNLLSVVKAIPQQRRFCVCFHPVNGEHYFGVAVDVVTSVDVIDLSILQLLPDCMYQPNFQITHFFERQDQLVFLSDIESLYQLFDNKDGNE